VFCSDLASLALISIHIGHQVMSYGKSRSRYAHRAPLPLCRVLPLTRLPFKQTSPPSVFQRLRRVSLASIKGFPAVRRDLYTSTPFSSQDATVARTHQACGGCISTHNGRLGCAGISRGAFRCLGYVLAVLEPVSTRAPCPSRHQTQPCEESSYAFRTRGRRALRCAEGGARGHAV